MKRTFAYILLLMLPTMAALAQFDDRSYNQLTADGEFTSAQDRRNRQDSVGGKHKEIPRGVKVWTIDPTFGDRTAAQLDTVHHLFMNSIFTNGMYGEYSTLGNLGAPRFNRIFIDSHIHQHDEFLFIDPYDYFVTPVENFRFTNTLSPVTNLFYNTCGSGNNGEDHLRATYAVNAGKNLGVGMKFDYLYGKGYYQNTPSAHFGYTIYGSYIGERYEAHLLASLNHQKNTENGGITNDEFILHPESFSDNYVAQEIPVVLNDNWNRNDNQHLFFTHRYNVGFNRKVPMTEEEIKARRFALQSRQENRRDSLDSNGNPLPPEVVDTTWMKNEYVPVTSFIHTLALNNYKRVYQAYQTPRNYYRDCYFDRFQDGKRFYSGDSIYDATKYLSLKNTVAIAMMEGFNKYIPMGFKVFAAHEIRRYVLPELGEDTDLVAPQNETPQNGASAAPRMAFMKNYVENDLSIGGQLQKTLGKTLHYDLRLEAWLVGASAGDIDLQGTGDINVPLLGDTVSLALKARLARLSPSFYLDTFHGKHLWWDNSLDKQTNLHLEGMLNLERTRTEVRVAFDEIKDYAYFSSQYRTTKDFIREDNAVQVKQSSDMISLFTLQLTQRLGFGPLNFEAQATYQKSTHQSIIPLPDLNLYGNLYLKFRISKVLDTELGADVRYFTKYEAPEYMPVLGQFCVQDNGEKNIKVGNYPIVNVYANFRLKQARFFVMMNHINAGAGNYFQVPHYPQNQSLFRFGVSWNFFN